MKEYSRLPVFSITRCEGRGAIPIVQWYEGRDGPFHKWDHNSREFKTFSAQSPFMSRQKYSFILLPV